PRPVPTADGLRVGADLVDVGDVGIDYRRAGGVERYPAPRVTISDAVDVAAVDDQVVWRLRQRSLIAAERDNVINKVRSWRHAKFDSDEPVVMSGRLRLYHRVGIRSDQFGHKRALGRGDSRSRRRQVGVRRRRADDDPTRAGLVGQPEIAGEGRSRLKIDHIAGPRLVDRRLNAAASHDVDGLSGRRNVSRIQKNARRLRVARSERSRARLVQNGFDNAGVEGRGAW